MSAGQEKDLPKGPETGSCQELAMELTPPSSPHAMSSDAAMGEEISPEESKADVTADPDKGKTDATTDPEENKANLSGTPEISITEASDTDESQDVGANTDESRGKISSSPEENKASPEENKASPEENKASPEENKASPEENKASPEENKASPEKELEAEQAPSDPLDGANISVRQPYLHMRLLNYVTEKIVQFIVIMVTLFLSYAIYRFRLELEDE